MTVLCDVDEGEFDEFDLHHKPSSLRLSAA